MDIRILMLFVLISVTGSFAELRSPFYRVRRNGLEEYGRPSVVAADGMSRMKRETVEASSPENTATPTASSSPKTSPTIASTKSDSASRSTTKLPPTTSSTPVSSSTTNNTPKSSPTTESTSKSIPTSGSTTPKSRAATAATAVTSAPNKPSSSEKPSEPESPPPAIAPRFGSSEDGDSNKPLGGKSGQPNSGNPNLASSFIPSYVPDFSSPYNFYDPTLNSVSGPGNYAWTGTSNGPGSAASFASAGASAGGLPNGGYNPMSIASRGAFVDDTPSVANAPNSANVPNMAGSWGFGGSGGDSAYFDPSSFAFPGYNIENIQKQMEEHFRQLQAQFQQQQKAIFESANRIGTDGYSNPNGHSAVSSISLGPGGGYRVGAINPAAPGVVSRFGEDIPPPSGNSYGVFSSSSSKTVIGPDGRPISHKVATTGVNDNGKITFRTVQD